MRKLLLALLGLILIAILSFYCFKSKAHSIQSNLLNKVDSTLNIEGYDWVKPQLVGEELHATNIVRLTGSAPTPEAKMDAERIVSHIEGVGGVQNEIAVEHTSVVDTTQDVETAAPVKVAQTDQNRSIVINKEATEKVHEQQVSMSNDYHIHFVKNANAELFMEGVVPSEEVLKKLSETAKKLFDEKKIHNKLSIAKGAPKDWNYMSQFGLEKLSEVDYGDMNITNSAYLFKAHLSSAQKKIAFLEGIKKVMSDPNNHYGRYRGDYIVTAPVQQTTPTAVVADTTKAPKVKPHVVQQREATPNRSMHTTNSQQEREPDRAYICSQSLANLKQHDKIYFDHNRATIKKSSYNVLNQIHKLLSQCIGEDKYIEIAGYTDSQGKALYNRRLSQRRAENVKRYLVDHGIPSSMLVAKGYGEADPIASNKNEAGRQLNRRIEFHIKGEK